MKFPHMARDRDLSLDVKEDSGSSPAVDNQLQNQGKKLISLTQSVVAR